MLYRKDMEWELRVLVNTYPDQVIAQYLRLTGQETFAAPIEAAAADLLLKSIGSTLIARAGTPAHSNKSTNINILAIRLIKFAPLISLPLLPSYRRFMQ